MFMFKELHTLRVKGNVNQAERDSITRLVLKLAGVNNVKTLETYDDSGRSELIIVAQMTHNTFLEIWWQMSQAHADTCLFDM